MCRDVTIDSEESIAIDDVVEVILTLAEVEVIDGAVIEERNVVNDVVAVIEAPAEDITLDLDSEEHQKIYRKLSELKLLFSITVLLFGPISSLDTDVPLNPSQE